jgi:hypothetical protein
VTESQAKRQLERMLKTLTPGSVLHLLADVIREDGDGARSEGNVTSYRQCLMVESTLIVVGMGLDAALPQ